jgi:hypothetical protein
MKLFSALFLLASCFFYFASKCFLAYRFIGHSPDKVNSVLSASRCFISLERLSERPKQTGYASVQANAATSNRLGD